MICQLARDNIWGYKGIHGELKRLNITISKTCIANILRRNGLPSSPDRKGLTCPQWGRHADVFLCADLLTKEVWTLRGLHMAFVFFVLHLQSRRVLLAQATFPPNGQWLKQQARNALWEHEEHGIEPRFFLHDRDACYSEDFDDLLKDIDIETVHTPYQAPNANAFAERWVRSLREECLNQLVILGLGRLQYVLGQYREFFNYHRPHQGIGNRIPVRADPGTNESQATLDKPIGPNGIKCRQFLGGLLKSYSQTAA